MKNFIPGIILFTCLAVTIYPQIQINSKSNLHYKIPGQTERGKLSLPYQVNKISSGQFQPTQIISDDSSKTLYTYNQSGIVLSKLDQKLINNVWINDHRITDSLNSSGKLIVVLYETWTINAWNNVNRVTYTYDNSGNNNGYLIENFTNGAWNNGSRVTNTYDNSGHLLTSLHESWPVNAWANFSRQTYTYDNNGNMLNEIYELWKDNSWVNYLRETYTYSASAKILTYTEESWNVNAWINQFRHTYSYDINDSLITALEEGWDNQWVNSSRITNTYDNTGNYSTILNEIWLNDAWKNDYKETFTNDNSGNSTTILTQSFVDNVWENLTRQEYNYDNNGNCIHGENFEIQNNAWVQSMGTLNLNYNMRKNNLYVYATVANINYTTFTGVTDGNTGLAVYNLEQNYPNPFNPSTTIKYSLGKEGFVKLAVYDITGSNVSELVNEYKPSGNYSVQFNAGRLASGIYIYKLESGFYTISKKFILLK